MLLCSPIFGSMPFKSLAMFERCVKKIKNMIASVVKKSSLVPKRSHAKTGKARKAMSAESDDILKTFAKIIHVKHVKIPRMGDRKKREPRAVATPLPPLNLSHKGKM